MVSQSQSLNLAIDLVDLSARLLAVQELIPRARIIARTIADQLPGTAVNVYVLSSHDDGEFWVPKATVGDVSVQAENVPADSGTLGELLAQRKVLLLSGKNLLREKYAHLDIRRTLLSLAYLPLRQGEVLAGAIEILSLEKELTQAQLLAWSPVADVSAAALTAAQSYENERHDALVSISRLTQLYDLEKVFASTLEMDELLPIIGSKFRDVMECEAVNLWLLQPDETVELMHQDGLDPTTHVGSRQKPGDGIAGDVSDNGEAVLIDREEDERLTKRNAAVTEGRVVSLLVVPIMDKESLVGVVEAVNKLDTAPFDEDDLFALTSLAETASSALHNASLLMAERKVEILETLVTVSHEITSTLDLERVLQAVVNNPATVIPYERAVVALQRHGRVQVKAISGTTQNPSAPEFAGVREMMEWASALNREIYFRQNGEEINSDREDTRMRVRAYFEQSGMRGFYVFPLADDQGRIGTFACESSDPDFLSAAHLEMINIVATQATVALRNASLYQEVPFITVLQPLLRYRERFRQLERRRQIALIAATIAVVAALAIIPIPMRVEGGAAVMPVVSSQVQARVEGVVRRVLVREGQPVNSGDLLGELEDWGYRDSLTAAEARYRSALAERNRALAANDGTAAGVQQTQADYWQSEVARARQRLERTLLLAPHSGVVVTPRAEELTGRHLDAGQIFVEIADTSRASVDVTVDERDLELLQSHEHASLKLETFPTRTFQGLLEVISPVSYPSGEDRVYYARLDVPNSQGLMHPGMQGRAKILVGWRPIGYVLFRRAAMWAYTKIWSWIGW